MAIHERDREELLRDGHTMVVRGEIEIDDCTVLIGFRAQGQASVYVGADPVFQFNARGELRRVFFQGHRYAAERGTLVELIRESRGGKVQLLRKPLDEPTLARVKVSASEWWQKIRQHNADTTSIFRVAGEDPLAFRGRVAGWLDRFGNEPKIADTPNA